MNGKLRTLMLVGLVSAGVVFGMGPAMETGRVWELREAIEEARRTSPEAAFAASRLVSAQALVGQARAAWLPYIGLEASYVQTDEPMQAFGSILNTGSFEPGLNFNRPGTVDHFQAKLQVVYQLYTGGSATARMDAARRGRLSAELELRAEHERLAMAVVQAYHQIEQMEAAVEAHSSAVESVTESLRVARERYARGQLLKNEVLNLEVRKAQLRERLLALQQQEQLARKRFMVLLGRPPVNPVRILGGERLFTEVPGTPARRAEESAAEAREQAAEALVRAARGAYLPQVEVLGQLQYDKGWRREGDGDSWLAGVRVRVPLFDGTLTANRVRESRADLHAAQAQLRAVELQMQLQQESARLAHELARQQLQVTSLLLAQAEESALMSRARFEQGDLLSTELIGVETRWIEAKMRHTQAEINERLALAELYWAWGYSLYTTN